MTTLSHTIVLNDTEMITLIDALKAYEEICERELRHGPRAPYWAHLSSIRAIRGRLFENTRQTSGSKIDPKTGEPSIWIDLPGRPLDEPGAK